MKKCKNCGKNAARGKSLVSLTARILGYCWRCYRERFPRRKKWNLAPLRQGRKRLLSPYELKMRERWQFEGREAELWSPEFYQEWLEQFKESG